MIALLPVQFYMGRIMIHPKRAEKKLATTDEQSFTITY